MDVCRIVLADDHPLFRQGLKRILADGPDFEIAGEVENGLELLKLLNKINPHLILLDISMPVLRGLEAISEIKRLRPAAKIVMLTMHRDPDYLFQAIRAGASAYVLKEDAVSELFTAIDKVRKGGTFLSQLVMEDSLRDWTQLRSGAKQPEAAGVLTLREKQILKLLAEGKSSKQIGDTLCISCRTVECHRANMMKKLGVKKTVDLIRYAIQKKYV